MRIVGVQVEACAPYRDALARGEPVDGRRAAHDRRRHRRSSAPARSRCRSCTRWVDELAVVGEDDVAEAIVRLLERAKLVVEGAGAVGVAALLTGAVRPATAGATVVVLSGGNVDAGLLASVAHRQETAEGRRLRFFTRDRRPPGRPRPPADAASPRPAATSSTVSHVRDGVALHVRETGVELTIETRGRRPRGRDRRRARRRRLRRRALPGGGRDRRGARRRARRARRAAAPPALRDPPARRDRGAGPRAPAHRRHASRSRPRPARGWRRRSRSPSGSPRPATRSSRTCPRGSSATGRTSRRSSTGSTRPGVRELFVPAGDAEEPGEFHGAADLLAAMGERRAPLRRDRHHRLPGEPPPDPRRGDDQRDVREGPDGHVHHQPDLLRPGGDRRVGRAPCARAGPHLPIWIGLPGSVDYAKLVRISMKIGLGESARFLRHHGSWMSRLMTRSFKPDPLVQRARPGLRGPGGRHRRLPPLHVQRGREDGALAAPDAGEAGAAVTPAAASSSQSAR